MVRSWPALGLGFVLGFGLAGCGDSPDVDDLYPLDAGLSWQYQVTTTRRRGADTQGRRTITNLERRRFAGEDGVGVRRNDDGIRYWEIKRDDGYYRLAVKTIVDKRPVRDEPPIKMLPVPTRAGARWQEPAHAFLLDRAKRFIVRRDKDDDTIALDYRIESTDTDVSVPAGHFHHCVLATGETTFRLGVESGVAASTVPIVQQEWYCPGIGLTRLTRDEKLTSGGQIITGGHMEIALIDGPN